MLHEALTVPSKFLIEDDDPIPKPMMSIDDAMAYHSKELAKAEGKLPAGYVDTPPTISTMLPLGTAWTSLASSIARFGRSTSAKPGHPHIERMAVSDFVRFGPGAPTRFCRVSSMLAAERVAATAATLRDCRPCRRSHSIRTSTRMLFSWSVTSTILPPTPSTNPATSSSTSMALTPGAYWEPMRKPSSSS